MNRIIQWCKSRVIDMVAFIVGLLVIERFIRAALDEPHTIKPKGKIAKFFYIPEIDRVPIIIGFAILLLPFTMVDIIQRRIAQKSYIEK